jgi:hypothetical protein
MQEVHTRMRLVVPPTVARTTWMLGFQRRGVRRCEWETLLPKPGPLPQTSQTEATGSLHCDRRMNDQERTKPPGLSQAVVEGYPTSGHARELAPIS